MIDLTSLMTQAQEMRAKMSQLEKVLEKEQVVGEAGGGMVQVIVNCKPQVLAVKIFPQGMQEQAEVIGELVVTATNEALKKANALKNKKQAELLGMPVNFPSL